MNKKVARFGVIILIAAVYFSLPGFDWRHFLLLAAQFVVILWI